VAVFWSEVKPLGHVAVSPDVPYVDTAVIKRLGEPPFWREPEAFTEIMKGVHQDVTSKALQLAFQLACGRRPEKARSGASTTPA